MNSRSGFTLIEVLVTSLLSTLTAGAILSALYMTTDQIQNGSASQRLIQYQITASEQIKSNARLAYAVNQASDAFLAFPVPLIEAAILGLDEVYFRNPDGSILAGYKVLPTGQLQEWKGGGFIDFQIGNAPVTVDYANSEFQILPNRRGVIFSIRYTLIEPPNTYYFPPVKEVVLCRNR